ncbi:unnamed protein product, partial [Ixodes hexagonus]
QKTDTVNVPKPDIRLPPPRTDPKTRVNIEGGGGPNNHRVEGRIEHDIFRGHGAIISGWGQGSHSSGPGQGSVSHGQVGVGIRIPFGGRRHKNSTH